MFLKKLLAGFAIASLLLMLAVGVLWLHSLHHVDHFSFPGLGGNTRADVTSSHGTLMLISTQSRANVVQQQARFYTHKQVMETCLLVPALWLAILIRAKLLPYRPDRVPRLRSARSLAEQGSSLKL